MPFNAILNCLHESLYALVSSYLKGATLAQGIVLLRDMNIMWLLAVGDMLEVP